MRIKLQLVIILFFYLFLLIPISIYSQETSPNQISFNKKIYPLYPKTFDKSPDIPSPFKTKDGMEILLTFTKHEKYALIPVTVENGNPLHYSKRIKSQFGKDQQLQVNSGDFPSLAKTGLHAEAELDKKDMITGIPISIITCIGRPKGFSWEGFMADDEDIISVLKGDNYLVKTMGLTHPQMAKPLFHVWNIILKEIELEKKLSSIHFSEMVLYYIMRYGFYEGHTDYRSDPVAIAYIFGLKSIKEIENAFQGNLYKALTNHFTKETVNKHTK